ncbi:MAG: response regulator transcription factor [Rhodobacteraceae bacterium]|nr:response regulator transcription factor [Paracoccaceae bacterium]
MVQKSILIVEDEDNIALAFEFFIGRQGYKISRVSDGEAALEVLARELPDLVMLDIMLPKRSGFEVCQMIRNNKQMDRVKILMITARGGKVERKKGIALGANDFMTKPFSSTDLLARIDNLIGEAGE